MRRRALAALIAATVASSGCGDQDDRSGGQRATPGIFVGTIAGTDAYIGIKSDGEEVSGYLCNGRRGVAASELVSLWLDEAVLEDGEAALTTREGEVIGSVTLGAEGASGEVEIDGESHPFRAAPASGGAGIYRETTGVPGASVKGWIVLGDGSLRGVQSIKDGTSNTFKPLSARPPSSSFIDPTTDI